MNDKPLNFPDFYTMPGGKRYKFSNAWISTNNSKHLTFIVDFVRAGEGAEAPSQDKGTATKENQ